MKTNEERCARPPDPRDPPSAEQGVRDARDVDPLLFDLFTNAPIAIGLREIRGREIVHLEDNPRAASLLGRSAAELRGVTDTELGVSREQVDRAIAHFRAARDAGRPLSAEITLPLSAKSRVMTGTVLALKHASAERYAFILVDVTELRMLQAAIERAESLATLGTLSATIGHEIGNPTMYAQAHLRAAIAQAKTENASAAMVGNLETALGGVEHVARILREMRTLTTAPMSSTDSAEVAAALHTVFDLLGDQSERATIHCESPNTPMVRGSSGRLVQVFLNLVRNAVESVAKQHGNVWIDVAQIDASSVQIDVADDGPGIDEVLRGRLFEPFATTKESGTGLGLYVSRMIVTRAGGKLEVHERAGGGVIMRVTLPIAS